MQPCGIDDHVKCCLMILELDWIWTPIGILRVGMSQMYLQLYLKCLVISATHRMMMKILEFNQKNVAWIRNNRGKSQ